MPLLSGDKVDRYVIDGFLGAGGMGEVYRAHDTRLERRVALKLVRPSDAGSASSQKGGDGSARMLREARSAAALDHPNVIAVYDVGQVEAPGPLQGATYIAMELVKGSSLRAFVGDESVPVDERVRWLTDVARALSAAHDAGIIHRDVKPENVMIRTDGIVKVLDFGIAKRAAAAPTTDAATPSEIETTAGVVLGTTMYMAPEQLRGEAPDARADQFAWGVLAFELLTGAPPWPRAAGPFVVASRILSDEPVADDSLSGAPPLVAAAVMRALRKDRARRFASMNELIEAVTGVFAKRASIAPAKSTTPAAHGTERDSAMSLPAGARAAKSLDEAAHDASDRREAGLRDPDSSEKKTGNRPSRSRARVVLGVAAGIAAVMGAAAIARSRVEPSSPSPSSSTSPRGSSPLPRLPGSCATNRECADAHGGKPWVCGRDQACVAVASADCQARFDPEDLARDDTAWIGAMLPLSGPRAQAFGQTDANVLELARRDFAGVGGVLGATRDGAMRRVALALCDTSSDPKRAAAHLVELGVPVVMGSGGFLKDTLDIVSGTFLPARTVTFDLFDDSPLVTRVPQPDDTPRLVWRLTSSAEQGGEALAHLLTDYVEPSLREPRGPLAGGQAMKLAVVRSDATTPAAILEAFVSKVSMNGKPLVDNLREFEQRTFSRGDSDPRAREAIIDELVAFAPHAIVYADSEVFEDAFVEAIERRWRAPYQPMYVSEGVLANPKLLAFVGTHAERRSRFLSVDLPANTEENFRFVLHYNEQFDPDLTPGTAPGVVYDAYYVAAYAIAATEKPRPSGRDLAQALSRIGGSDPAIGVGASHIFEAYEALRQGRRLHLTGAGTQLELDAFSGEIPTDFAVYCMGKGRDGRASEPVESGLRYDHREKRIVGAMRCP